MRASAPGVRAPQVRVVAQVDLDRLAVGVVAAERPVVFAGERGHGSGPPGEASAWRARAAAAWAGRPSASASSATSSASASAPARSISWMVNARRKCCVDRPEKLRARPDGGQHVVAAGHVVAVRHRRPGPDEGGSRRRDPARDTGRVGGHDREVLGRVAHGEVDALVERGDRKDRAGGGERLAADLGPRSLLELPDERSLGFAGDPRGGGDQHARGVRVVLGLGEHLGGDEPRIGPVVGQHEHLGGAGRAVDDHVARDLGFGFGDPAVAGPDDGVHPGHGLGAERERGDRAGAAQGEEPVRAGHPAGGEHLGRGSTVRPGGRAHHHLPHARGPGGHDAHEHGARVGGAAAGRVHAGPLHRNGHPCDPDARLDVHRDVGGDLRGVERRGCCGPRARARPAPGRRARRAPRPSWPRGPRSRPGGRRRTARPSPAAPRLHVPARPR